jgi:hypothetical protein
LPSFVLSPPHSIQSILSLIGSLKTWFFFPFVRKREYPTAKDDAPKNIKPLSHVGHPSSPDDDVRIDRKLVKPIKICSITIASATLFLRLASRVLELFHKT